MQRVWIEVVLGSVLVARATISSSGFRIMRDTEHYSRNVRRQRHGRLLAPKMSVSTSWRPAYTDCADLKDRHVDGIEGAGGKARLRSFSFLSRHLSTSALHRKSASCNTISASEEHAFQEDQRNIIRSSRMARKRPLRPEDKRGFVENRFCISEQRWRLALQILN